VSQYLPRTPLPRIGPDGAVTVPGYYSAGSKHHLAKGLLFAGVAHGDVTTLAAAARLAAPGLEWAVHLATADLGVDAALAQARETRAAVVPPASLCAAVYATPVANRLGAVTAGG
jgi:hypothetical protein